jgi:hypothetical protein
MGAHVIAFDFLYDPRTAFIERVRSYRLSRQLGTAVLALVTAIVVVLSGWWIERSRALDAELTVAHLRIDDAALRARLIREKLEAAEVADLGSLDGRLRAIAASGPRFRSRLATLAKAMPRDAWLVSLTDDGHRLSLVGRTSHLKGVASAMARLAGARFGFTSLDRVARVERPAGALLEFSFALGGR